MKRTPLKRKSPLGRSRKPRQAPPKRLWGDVDYKLVLDPRCRICNAQNGLQRAHTIGREHDERCTTAGPGGWVEAIYVHPDSIVWLCGPFEKDCHGRYDRGEVDLLPHLTLDEQLDAVKRAGGLEAARIRLCPTAYRKFAVDAEKS